MTASPRSPPAPAPAALAEDLGLLCWLLKDAAWVVLCPYVSIPAALAAIVVETSGLIQQWSSMFMPQQMHALAVLLWLLGNSVWMCGELLFTQSEGAGRQFPWFSGPLFAADEGVSEATVACAQLFFAAGFLACARCYLRYVAAALRGRLPRLHEAVRAPAATPPEAGGAGADVREKVFGVIEPDVYSTLFIGPWILKDFFWTFGNLGSALACSAVVAALIGDGLRRSWDVRSCAELLWVSGNTVWIIAELGLMDTLRWMRVVACAILLVGCIPLVQAMRTSIARGEKGPHEGSHLLGPSAARSAQK